MKKAKYLVAGLGIATILMIVAFLLKAMIITVKMLPIILLFIGAIFITRYTKKIIRKFGR